MKLRRVAAGGKVRVELLAPQGWVPAAAAVAHLPGLDAGLADDVVGLLGLDYAARQRLDTAAAEAAPAADDARPLIPFTPRSFRDFMLYGAHAVAAARGFVRRFMPAAAPLVGAYEAVTRRTFPSLSPHDLWHRQPIYYMGNHLTFAADGEDITVPDYTRALDYELELGFVLAKPLRDADAPSAERAIGGFVVLNDFSARDVQLAEMRSGFGPQKAKHFRSAMSGVVVSADEILPRWRDLEGSVRLNGRLVAECATRDARWSLGEVLAHASRGELLYPGELFGSGTLPGGSGIEHGRLLARGDTIALAIDGIGELTNKIV
ncbi:MAG: fumarylacetoacetate hydrolase family protein [Hyphomicrobium sp.]|uniref:fumarylacetoacetate hydrolase family protein n=1 Tax=Hyphomicrobium sp. TaxID=82 RepID=UPI001320A6B3|nr:fumarylacetoacetate hydrolase family protein [Hyphomicrobium sp.]KAB2939303.1 MAG: fumarylacetoacetate hydrolase family protein [Hyphomicrobium sp.]MBZ0211226.1 fumarylacetoacetate hydrolase family protein [Hyphomicrobium sp.]